MPAYLGSSFASTSKQARARSMDEAVLIAHGVCLSLTQYTVIFYVKYTSSYAHAPPSLLIAMMVSTSSQVSK